MPLVPNKPSDDVYYRHRDMAIYHILIDAGQGGEEFYLVGKNIFRPKQKRPIADEFVANRRRAVELIHDE